MKIWICRIGTPIVVMLEVGVGLFVLLVALVLCDTYGLGRAFRMAVDHSDLWTAVMYLNEFVLVPCGGVWCLYLISRLQYHKCRDYWS